MIGSLTDRERLEAALSDEGRRRLGELRAQVAAEPGLLDRVFPAVAREVGRGGVPDPDGGEPVPVADAARVELLAAAEATAGAALLDEMRALYRFGDADEKRAVLLALHRWDDSGPGARIDGTDLLDDALRTNDTRLVAAAMGRHASRLSDSAWRHGVLKCLFTGVPVSAVAGLAQRADAELGAMAGRYARERRAAGRAVPDDVDVVLAACPSEPPTGAQPEKES